MTYQIVPLPLAPFAPLFALSDDALLALGARRMVADRPHSAPCRVSLVDAAPGERLILAHHIHLDAPASPYRAGGPVFVRETAVEAAPVIGIVPDPLGRRLLSARAYDADGMMTDADVVEGQALDARLRRWLADPVVAQVQLHTARRGCYLARAVRPD
ncbi:MAG: hypothetical protein ACI9YM_001003 [Brevundimonas sp.]|jgi:hypothetical protein|uniref:DUF1203 domain-containing protein n=1 Tax=Brevundimonas sp. TaxID=1871086 RepID=UPI0039E4384F